MLRDLLWGGLFFAAGYAVAKNLDGVKKDLAHYDNLRAMSGEPPFVSEQMSRLSGLAGIAGGMLGSKDVISLVTPILRLIPGIRDDVERYTKLRAM
jgi:hypothetical protein